VLLHRDALEVEHGLDVLQDAVVDLVAVPQPHDRVVFVPEECHPQIDVLLLAAHRVLGGGLVAVGRAEDPQTAGSHHGDRHRGGGDQPGSQACLAQALSGASSASRACCSGSCRRQRTWIASQLTTRPATMPPP